MSPSKNLLCGVFLLSFVLQALGQGCEINPLSSNAPLIIRPENTTIINPTNGMKTITFKAGEKVQFACPKANLNIGGSLVEATCISNTNFKINDERVQWSSIKCNQNIKATAKFLDSNCGFNARLAEIGFELDNERFLKTITVCFNTFNQTTLYSYYIIPASIGSHAVDVDRPSFYEDRGFFDTGSHPVNQLYVKRFQRATINKLLGLSSSSTKYIANDLKFFLSRGHLAAKADFIYAAFQLSTFRYINAAPQWQSDNGGNWNTAEANSRSYADKNNVDLQVWTGTYGVTTLPHESTGEDIPLYLYVDGRIKGLPVPAIYWKILYNPDNKKGIVLITLNNPYENDFSKYVICPDISSQVNWLKWKKTNIKLGYSYACTISSFRKVVTYAPNLSASGLLL